MGTENISSLLVVEKSKVALIKPSKPTPNVSLSFSTIDNDPFFEGIVQTVCIFAPKPQANHDLSSLLKYALSQALVYYYPLAGKLHRKSDNNRLELNCKTGDGVPFIEATASCTLASLNYLENIGDEIYNLVACYEPVRGCEEYDPMALQVTKFACGGITIGITYSHSVFDCVGVAHFFRAMTELASGKTELSVIPVWERERLTFNHITEEFEDYNQIPKSVELPKASPSIATSPYKLTDDMVREIVHITSEDITKLKKKITEGMQTITNDKDVAVTTFEIIAAHMWRSRSRALKLDSEGTTTLGIAVGIRGVMEPPLPKGYYGNAVITTSVAMKAKELDESSLTCIVRLIKEMKREALDKHYLSEKLSVIETNIKNMDSFEGHSVGFTVLTDWRHVGLMYDGCGGLVNIVPLVPKTVSFLCVLLPASKAVQGTDGGVRLRVTLPREAMVKFKEEMNDI